jgi:MFS transporter, MHS family, proline/betaine transporter
LVEYYDYSLYAFSATLIANAFFSKELSAFDQIKAVFELYAIGYLAKPLGALVFGFLGDVYGRKKALSLSILGIAFPTAVIGFLPEYEFWGIYSSLILMFCRLMQSIFTAGEYDGAALYVIEHFGKRHRYLASSLTRCSGALGLLMGVGISYLFSLCSAIRWAWRLPFLLSLPFALFVLVLRRNFQETPDFQERKAFISPSLFWKSRPFDWIVQEKAFIIRMMFLAGGFGVTYQIAVIFMKPYLSMRYPDEQGIISLFSVIAVACFAISMPFFGFYADRMGVRKIFLYGIGGFWLAAAVLSVSLYFHQISGICLGMLLVAIGAAPLNALTHGFVFDSLVAEKRYRGISLGHTLGSMFMSGSAAWVCSVGMTYWLFFPILYMLFFSILFLFILWTFDQKSGS